MYGSAIEAANSNNLLRNEVSFTNLIAIANNPAVFNSLDTTTQQELVKILCAYTRGCIDSILESYNKDARSIQSQINNLWIHCFLKLFIA